MPKEVEKSPDELLTEKLETAETEEVVVENDKIADEPEVVVEDNPFADFGFESVEDFKTYVSESKTRDQELTNVKSEWENFRAGADSQRTPEVPIKPDKNDWTLGDGMDEKTFASDDGRKVIEDYAQDFFRSPQKAVVDLIKAPLEAFVWSAIDEVLSGRDTQQTLDGKADYKTANQEKFDTIASKYPDLSELQILDILEISLPEPQQSQDSDAAREKDSRSVNTKTGSTSRSDAKNSAPYVSDSGDDAMDGLMTKLANSLYKE